MIPLFPIDFDKARDTAVVSAQVRVWGPIYRNMFYVWNGYFWEELPLPWWRRFAVVW